MIDEKYQELDHTNGDITELATLTSTSFSFILPIKYRAAQRTEKDSPEFK